MFLVRSSMLFPWLLILASFVYFLQGVLIEKVEKKNKNKKDRAKNTSIRASFVPDMAYHQVSFDARERALEWKKNNSPSESRHEIQGGLMLAYCSMFCPSVAMNPQRDKAPLCSIIGIPIALLLFLPLGHTLPPPFFILLASHMFVLHPASRERAVDVGSFLLLHLCIVQYHIDA